MPNDNQGNVLKIGASVCIDNFPKYFTVLGYSKTYDTHGERLVVVRQGLHHREVSRHRLTVAAQQ